MGEWYRAQNQGREVGTLLDEEQSKQKKSNRDGHVHPPCAWNGGMSDICVTYPRVSSPLGSPRMMLEIYLMYFKRPVESLKEKQISHINRYLWNLERWF